MVILIAPSKKVQSSVEQYAVNFHQTNRTLNSFRLLQFIISISYQNWPRYIRHLEAKIHEQVKQISSCMSKTDSFKAQRVMSSRAQNTQESTSDLTDMKLSFLDRQKIKLLEDKMLDLVMIFDSLFDTLSNLERECRAHCLGFAPCSCTTICTELAECMQQTQLHLKKVKVLHKKIQNTAQLVRAQKLWYSSYVSMLIFKLSDLLKYQNAKITQSNETALNGLIKETKDENSKMRILTVRLSCKKKLGVSAN
jgi:hypothetical protein